MREAMDDMNCKAVRQSLWDYVADTPAAEVARDAMERHLRGCRECDLRRADAQSLRSGLRHLPLKHVPALLETRLQVLASRERSRQAARRNFRAWATETFARLKLSFDNLLKPFAVPAAGGLLTSFLCFGVIVNTLHVVPDWGDDIPIGISTEVAIDELSPFCFTGRDVMVQLTVDSTGHVTDFEPQEQNPSPEALREIGNLVLYSTFTPAMRLGRPVASKRFFVIRHISVRG